MVNPSSTVTTSIQGRQTYATTTNTSVGKQHKNLGGRIKTGGSLMLNQQQQPLLNISTQQQLGSNTQMETLTTTNNLEECDCDDENHDYIIRVGEIFNYRLKILKNKF